MECCLGLITSDLQCVSKEVEAIEKLEFVDTPVYASLLRRCGQLRALELGRRVHAHIVHSDAKNKMRFVGKNGHMRLRALKQLAVEMYGRCGCLTEARAVFDSFRRWHESPWSAMISAYTQNGHSLEALELFRKVHWNGLRPDSYSFCAALEACTELGDLREGKKLHEWVVAARLGSNAEVVSALVNMYGRFGMVEAGRKLFDACRGEGCWNPLISAYAQQGDWKQAIQLYDEMILDGVEPSETAVVDMVRSCTSLEQTNQVLGRVTAFSTIADSCTIQGAVAGLYMRLGNTDETFDPHEAKTQSFIDMECI